ncbi:MAG: hypothetical protein AVDCRST_MAG95-2075 [uncultured Adhaeribacter sp.]|uniref:Uncharacterized protein n=1 Tax=uncultured Adhaeribacter sp. TaxID=448109 RepID=A0A6J4IKP5_9BACT|nr:MAG: hypothetical protein AVDCRST_MAG95-2075 [uncultured Adhaeribacter sp.]
MISRYFVIIVLVFSSVIIRAQVPNSKKARITAVENSLMPYVPIRDFKGWNLPARMKFYRVPGVSIAVIHNFKLDWVKGYGLADTLKNIPVTSETMFSVSHLMLVLPRIKFLPCRFGIF